MSSLETPSRLKTALVTLLLYAIGIIGVAALFANSSTATTSNAAIARNRRIGDPQSQHWRKQERPSTTLG